jgi:hypothetical protein
MERHEFVEMVNDLEIKVNGNLNDIPELGIQELEYRDAKGVSHPFNMYGTFATVDNWETMTPLRAVSAQYKLVQHYDPLADFIQKIYQECPEYGNPVLDIDMRRNGGCMWAHLRFPDASFTVNGHKLVPRLTTMTSADLTQSYRIVAGIIMTICGNGLVVMDSRFPGYVGKRRIHKTNALSDKIITEEINDAVYKMKHLSEAAGIWENYAKRQVTSLEMSNILDAIKISPKQQEELMTAGLRSHKGESLIDKYTLNGESDGWTAYSAVTQWITDNVNNPQIALTKGESASRAFDALL